MAKSEFFGFMPLRGVRTGSFNLAEIWEHPWTVVSVDQVDDLNELLGKSGGFRGNLKMISARLNPDSFLVVKRYLDPSNLTWAEVIDVANSIVSALNFCALLNTVSDYEGYDRDAVARKMPTPIWIPAFPENCELPLLTDRERVRLVGHSSPINWAGLLIDNNGLRGLLGKAPEYIQKIAKLEARPNATTGALAALTKSFNCTSIGQFCAQALGALDILLSESNAARWENMSKVATTLCGLQHQSNVEALFNVRHNFVHRQREPADKAIHIKCLALVVTVIKAVKQLEEKFKSVLAAQFVLEAIERLNSAKRESNADEITAALTHIGAFDQGPLWASQWLEATIYDAPVQ
jgi:hypothetical protein